MRESAVPKFDSHLNFELGPSTDDPGTWSMIQKWFTTCLESHDHCRKPEISSAYIPTRVLELDYSRPTQTFRLIPGTECPLGSHYVTLSYCWGKKPVDKTLRLLKSTINEIMEKQPVEILPKTFRDALSIADRFGTRYVWMDRLCIYQDSLEDWRREAASMQEVYKNAFLNISALGAEDDDGGCFFSRDPSEVAPGICPRQACG
jgi:Heterokaryon incompatibility protein (HET)